MKRVFNEVFLREIAISNDYKYRFGNVELELTFFGPSRDEFGPAPCERNATCKRFRVTIEEVPWESETT